MISKNIDQITEKDLQELIDNSVAENKTIEYKRLLPDNSESKRKEFLADVSSFANASGGDLIYGIGENKETGVPESLDGLVIQNADQEIGRLESIIRDGIEPRISSIIIKPITLSNSQIILIIRTPKSWNSPHRVSFQGHDKFYSRNSNGKYPIDVGELRNIFNLSETRAEKIKKFREDRISIILSDETYVPLYKNPKVVLHLIPLNSFDSGQKYDISKIADEYKLRPIFCSGWSHRYNLDGLLAYASNEKGESHSYIQLFRNGIIEAVDALMLEAGEKKLIPGGGYERELIKSLTEYLSIVKTLNVEPPFFIFLSLLEVKGYTMGISESRIFDCDRYPIDKNILLLPEVVMENYNVGVDETLRPCFDAVWNACGFKKDPYYNEKGNWIEK